MKTMMKPVCAMVILAGTSFSAYADTRAEAAKKAFDTLMEKTDASYERYQKWPFFDKLSSKTTDYKAGEDSSTATIVSEIAMKSGIDGDKPLEETVTAKVTITHTEALAEKGIVARVETKLDKLDTNLEGEAAEVINKQMATFNDKMKSITDVYKDGKVHSHVSMDANKEGDVEMRGFVANWHTTLDDVANLYGTLDGELKGIEGNGSELQPFTFEGKYDKSGEFNFSTSPIVLKQDDNTLLEIKKVSVDGNLVEVKSLDFGLVSAMLSFNDFSMNDPSKLPMPVAFKQLQFGVKSTANDNESVSMGISVNLEPSGDWIKAASGMVDLSKVKLAASIDNVPAEILNKFSGYVKQMMEASFNGEDQEALGEKIQAELEKDAQKWGDLVEETALGTSVNVDIDSDKGKIFADARVRLKPNDVDWSNLEESSMTPDLLLSALDISAQSSLPASLVEQLQVQMMLAFVYQKKGDKYVTDIKTEDNKLLINDVPFDLSQFAH